MRKDDNMSEADLKMISERIDALCEERPSHKEVLEFLKGIMAEKLEAKQHVHVDSIDLDESLLAVKREEGFPLVDKKELQLDRTSARRLFDRLCEQLRKKEKTSGDIERITQALEKEEFDMDELFDKALAEDFEYFNRISDKLNVAKGILFFLADNSLQPIFEVHAEKLKGHVDQTRWWRAYCPICGSKPVMAELVGQERKKFLVCSRCGYEWRFKRTQCPFCENEERKGFKYFFTENEGRVYRVETCQKCKKYIKTVDTQELDGKCIPAVEDIGTLHLDVIAQKEGYERPVSPLGLNLLGS